MRKSNTLPRRFCLHPSILLLVLVAAVSICASLFLHIAPGPLSSAPQNHGVSNAEGTWYRRQPAYAPSGSFAPSASFAPTQSYAPSTAPSYAPSTSPSYAPSTSPSYAPSSSPSYAPSQSVSSSRSYAPSTSASPYAPSVSPSRTPSASAPPSGAALPEAKGLSSGALAGIFLVTGALLALAGVALWRACARRPENPYLRKEGVGMEAGELANPLFAHAKRVGVGAGELANPLLVHAKRGEGGGGGMY